jgi:hypothetical protein
VTSRSTPSAIAFPEPVRVRRHVIDAGQYAAATNDAPCLACGERIEHGTWLTSECPGPKTTTERSA